MQPTLIRLPDWAGRLAALVSRAHSEPFAWGRHDCCLWAADAVQATTGVDLATDLRGGYTDARGAYRRLTAIGGLRGAAARAGALVAPLRAWAGDVGLVRFDGRPMLAVCQGEVWLCAATRGLAAVPLAAASFAWGVGHA